MGRSPARAGDAPPLRWTGRVVLRRILGILGWVLILSALLVAADETYRWLDEGSYRIIATGKLWYDLSPSSLNLVQAVVQRHILPALWDDLVRPLLLLPAWLVLGLSGLLIVVLRRKRRRRKRTLAR